MWNFISLYYYISTFEKKIYDDIKTVPSCIDFFSVVSYDKLPIAERKKNKSGNRIITPLQDSCWGRKINKYTKISYKENNKQ